MISPEHKKTLIELNKTQFGVVLKQYLSDEMENLSDITKPKTWEETLGRQSAVKIIKKLFKFMEGKDPVEKTKNQYE